MFRRARLNVRPNVRPAGRSAGSAADPKPQSSDSPVAATTESAAGEATEPPPVAPEVDSDNKADGANDAGEASKPAEVPMQRRKRISTMPNLVKPRAAPSSAHQPASKPQRRASQAPEGSALLQKEPSPSEKSHAESPVKPPMLPEKKTPVPQVPQFSPLKKSVSKEQTVCVAAQKNDDCLQKNVASPLKERPTQERSGAQEEKLPTKPPVKEKRTCSDRERILKARKLREMLKEELKKERMLKHRPPIIEGRSPPDHSKMTMRDLIYYLPENNPMKSSLAEEKRTERNSALSQMKEQEEKSTPDCDDDNEKEEGENEESQDGPLLVPRVKVAEDGSIILDEESLTVEVLRTKGPCVVEENDPIFERGSTTTYSSFRKSFYTKPWSNKETDMFFLAISMVGTDFSLIGRLFPHRARAEIKNKFKREEKANGWRIDKAFKEKRPFDFEFFAQLLEKVLADEEKRKQKTVKSQKPKEKKPSRPRKKPKAKNTNTEAANEQGDLQEDRISDAEADAVMAEKENEESLGISEEAEQTALEPALTKKKKKRKRKDDLEEEVENLLEETSVPSKAAEVKSSKKIAEKKVPCDASNDGHTAGGEEMNSVMEGNQGETAVTREERSESCLPADHRMETENSVNLCSFEDGSDVMLETNSAELRTQDVSCTLQESEISELTVVETRGKERQSEETSETKKKEGEESPRQEESQSASESDSQSEIMKNRKRGRREKVQAPQSSSERSVRRRNAAPQEKMKALAPVPVNADEKCLAEDSRRNKDEATAGETMDLESKSQESEEAVAAKAVGRGRRQRFKPHVTKASVRREEPGKGAEEDKVPHPWPKRRTRKYTDPSKSSGPISEGATGKDDKGLETISESNEAAGLQEGSKQSVLKPAPLKRGRGKRSTPNLPQTVARQKGKKGKTAGVQVVEALIHRWDDKSDPFPITDVMAHEDARPCSMMLEEGVPSDSKMDTKLTQQSPQEKSAESKDYESEKESSDVLEKVSELETGEPDPQKGEEKTSLKSAWFLRTLLQKPEPNLRTTATRKEELEKAGEDEVLQPTESLKTKSLGSKVFSVGQGSESTKTFSRSEHGELKSCPPELNQDDTSTTNAGKNATEEERKETPLRPAQVVQSRFQRYKLNLEGTVGRRESQIPGKEREKELEPEQPVLQKNESTNTVITESEVALPDLLNKEKQLEQEMPHVPSVSGSKLCEQSSAEKSASQKGKLGALKPGQFRRHKSVRTRPDQEREHSKESPVAQKLAGPIEEKANKEENPPVAEGSEEPLSSKGESPEDNTLDVTPESMKSEALSSPEKSFDCHSKGEQGTHLPTDDVRSIEDTMESDKLSFGEESKERDTQPMHQEKKPNLESRPNLMGVTGREDDPKEGENRGEDTAENTDAAKCLMLEEPGVSSQSSTERVEAASFSKATRKRNFMEPVKTPFKRFRQNTVQSSEISSESDSDEEYYSCQQRVKVQQWKRLRRPTKGNALPKLFLEQVPGTSSECETDSSEEENQTQDSTPCSSRGNKFSIAYRKKFRSKLFQASQEKEEEEKKEKEKDDTEPNESEYFTLEEANKVPAFLPKGLPKPVPVQTDETMEEMSRPGVQVAADAETPKPEIQKERKESTSAAETTAHEDPEVDKGTSSKELLPSGYESMINAENQSTGTGTDVKEYFEESAVGTRRGGEMQGRNSGELTAEATSLKPEGSCLGAEDSQNKSSVAEISEQSPCRAEASVSNVSSQQVGAHAQQRCVSSMEATSVGKDDHKCLEEEQSFILTLVGISNYSKGLDASPLLEDIPEEYLPAPIIIKPIKTRESVATEVKSSGSLATDDDEFAEPSRSYAEAKLESTPSEAFLDLQAIQKRSSSYEDIDSPPAKRTLSGAGAEGNLDTIYKGYSSKSDDSPDETCASPFQDTDDLSKENLLSSLLLFDSTALLPGKKHDETSETLKTASRENEASKQEKEVMMSGLTSKSKEEISGQGKQEHVHEFALLEPTVSLPSESQLLSSDQKSLEFLPSTCKKSSSESTEDIKGKTEKTQSSQIVSPKESPKDPTQSTQDKESCSISSTMASLSMEDEKVGAETADMVPTNKPQEMPPFCEEDEEKEEEAIKISEYFFSDIFMEVDDSD
ncbi:transcription factor TFIIIB component B'' homolog isoform X2 [Pogoniulus pusillus]|uniref:transcription factor TFIIIB component B'' homolog isoform X2 n=1 Tax=Pogoniulus pusillus TaxID=488313 RepID=UPI0030B94207